MSSNTPATPEQIHAEASQWTQHGITLLERGDRDALLEAQVCFEQAIALRQDLALETEPQYRWGLTAGWMNRGDALTRLGGAERLEEAVRCYDIAIAHLHQLPLDADPAYRWRLSVAWINRGMTLQALPEAALPALQCFDSALQIMLGHEASPRVDYQQVQASAWMNRANVLLQLPAPDWHLALASACQALKHSRTCENDYPAVAEAGIKARHTLCRCVAHLLEQPGAEAALAEKWILEATDAVEDVMRLTNNPTDHFSLREEVFHFGCRIYRAFQPHFLAEFLDEGLTHGDMSPAMRMAAHEALTQAASQMQRENLAGLTPSRLDKLLNTLQALSQTGKKLGF